MNQIEYTDRFIDGFRRMAAKVVKRRTWGVLDAEDLVQVALLSTLRPTPNPTLRAWGSMVSELKRNRPYYFRTKSRQGQSTYRRFVPMQPAFINSRRDTSVASYPQDFWGGVEKVVGPRIAPMLKSFFTGHTQSEIAAEAGISPAHAARLIREGVSLLQGAWSDQPIRRRARGERLQAQNYGRRAAL